MLDITEKQGEYRCRSTNSLSILQVTPYITPTSGGLATVVHTLSKQLAKSADVTVLVVAEPVREQQQTAGGYRLMHTLLRRMYDPRHRLKSLVGGLVYFIPSLLILKRIFCETKATIVHLHFGSPDYFYFRVLCALMSCNYVVTLHGSDIWRFYEQSKIDRFLFEFMLRGAHRVIAVSDGLARRAVEVMPWIQDTISVVHNGVDMDAIRRARDTGLPPGLSENDFPYFVAVGNLVPVKGHDVLIEAWALLKQRGDDHKLLIIGDGERHAQYQRMIEDLGCSEQIRLLGRLEKTQVWSIMSASRGMILPSRSEGLSCVVQEAGVLGIPVIASRVGGVPELISHEQEGLLVCPEQHQAIVEAVLRIVNDTLLAKSCARNLQLKVNIGFTAQTMAKKYVDFYDDIFTRSEDLLSD